MYVASSAIRGLARRAESQVEPLVGHSLVWSDPPKGTARTLLAWKETERPPVLVASLPRPSPSATRAP